MSNHNLIGFDEEQMKIIQSYRLNEAQIRDEIKRLEAELERVRGELAIERTKNVALQNDAKAAQSENAAMREAIANLIYSITEEGYKAAHAKAERLIAPELPHETQEGQP